MRKTQSGITLISLIITIIVMLILASTAIYSGVSTINSSKLTTFETELRIMQAEVNELYDKYRNGETVLIDSVQTNILELGQPAIGTGADANIEAKASIALTGAEVADDSTIRENYRYFTQEYLEKLGVEGINQDFLLNIKSRKVVSYQGFQYQGMRYYTLEQVTDRIYNVEYEENENIPTFEADVTQLENDKWKINIKNIQYEGYVEKWQVKYQIDGWDYWAESDSLEFIVSETGYYNIYITNQDISSGEVIIPVGASEPEPAPSTVSTLNPMLYGVIEVEFLDGTSYRTTEEPNTPILKDGMQPVYWAADTDGNVSSDDPQSNTVEFKPTTTNYNKSNWYQYVVQTEEDDGKTSRWANATTSDGSYYVWIPRYAYRIVYFNNETNEKAYRAGTLTEEDALNQGLIVGYSDARGIVDSEGKRPTNVTSTTSIAVNDKYFRTHPLFDGNVDEGGWDSKLEGIWVMKYEASMPGATETLTGSGEIPMSVPNVKAWTGIDVSNMFTYAKNAYNNGEIQNTTLNSHMMKNSEWGAIAYLAESKYGRNGTEISVNQCSDKVTGTGRGLNSTEDGSKTGTSQIYNSTYEYTAVTDKQKYTGTVGQLSSATGNIYGIYDVSGGAWEYVMGFYGTDENTPVVGNSNFTLTTFPNEKKYFQIYSKTNSNGEDLGDSLYETKGWNNAQNLFTNSNSSIFTRGGIYIYSDKAGIFNFNGGNAQGYASNSFRVCLAIN